MMSVECTTPHTPRHTMLSVLWAIALVGLGVIIELAYEPGALGSDRSLPAENALEDWHGNVRRSG